MQDIAVEITEHHAKMAEGIFVFIGNILNLCISSFCGILFQINTS